MLGHTDYKLLRIAGCCAGGITALASVSEMYRHSKQPLKKAKTFVRYFREMEKKGLVKRVPIGGELALVTMKRCPFGRREVLAYEVRVNREFRRQPPTESPTYMRLATD